MVRWSGILSTIVFIAVQSAAAADWIGFQDAARGFGAQFPAEPEITTESKDGITMKTYAAMSGGALCFVGVSDLASIPSVDEELKANRDNFVSGVEATTTATEMTTFAHGEKHWPAVTFDAESNRMYFRSIVVVKDLRVLQIVGGVNRQGGDRSMLDRCVASFRLLP